MSITMLVLSDSEVALLSPDSYIPIPSSLFWGDERKADLILDLPDTAYIGLCRQDVFLTSVHGKDSRTVEAYLNKITVEKYKLENADSLYEVIGTCDALYAHPLHLKQSVEKQLLQEECIKTEDLELFLSILKNSFPHMYDRAKDYLSSNHYFDVPLCVMKKSMFSGFLKIANLCNEELFKHLEPSLLTKKRMNSLDSFLPMLLYLYVKESPNITCVSTASVRFTHFDTPLSLQRWKKESIAIVFAANERFAPALGVCLASLLAHTDSKRLYDIVVLESDMSLDSKKRLLRLASSHTHVCLRFYNPKAMLHSRKLQKNPTDHISLETYYRFLIPDIIPSYEKVLYLDCDTVILDDVAKLYDTDLEGYVLAAALDVEIPALCSGIDPGLAEYVRDVLHLQSNDPYLQAGVLLMNIPQMRSLHSVDTWLALAGERKFRYNDQDILNKECKGRFKTLPLAYNTVVDCDTRRIRNLLSGPLHVYEAYLEARENPKIVHYAGFEKPWDAPQSDFAYLFWHYALYSEFYDRLLSMVQEGKKSKTLDERILPRGSKRRMFVKQLLFKFSST